MPTLAHPRVLLNQISYDSFGKVLNQTNASASDRFLFTARELDAATQQYFYRARYYNASTGKFIQQDPIGFEGLDVNLFRYANNSPTNGIDPSGTVALNEYKLLKVVGLFALGVGSCFIPRDVPVVGGGICKLVVELVGAAGGLNNGGGVFNDGGLLDALDPN